MSNYFFAKDGKQTGPFDESEVLRQVAAGVLSANDLCWREGMGNWEPIAEMLAVSSAQSSPPPILGTPPNAVEKSPLFLHIPISRLILMSILSFSLYEVYRMKRETMPDLSPEPTVGRPSVFEGLVRFAAPGLRRCSVSGGRGSAPL